MKNEIFSVSNDDFIWCYLFVHRLTLAFFSECGTHLGVTGRPPKRPKGEEGEVVDLRQGMEELSVAGKTATEEISQLKVDLYHEVVAHSSREEELVWLTEELVRLREKLGKKGPEMLKDSELQ